MVTPFGFSVGDVIAVSILIKDAIKALDDSRGSSSEYKALINELLSLDRALLEVLDLVSNSASTTIELNALSQTVKRVAEQCQQCIGNFLDRIKCYSRSLRDGAAAKRFHVRDTKDKIMWTLTQKDELARFRAEIAGHTSAINMLLITVTARMVKISESSVASIDAKVSEVNRKTEESSDQQLNLLSKVLRIVSKGNSQQRTQTKTVTNIMSTFRYFCALSAELRSLMTKIWSQNDQSYNILIDIQSRVPREFGPCWIQEPVIFTDALGRVAPLHLELVNSWAVLESILGARFENLPGQRKIERKEYIFQDQKTDMDIDFSLPFESSFRPGRKVEMSVIFKQETTGTSCPGCGLDSTAGLKVQVKCSGCGMFFQRFEDVLDGSPANTRLDSFGVTRKRPREDDTDDISSKKLKPTRGGPDAGINAFQRVRLLLPRTEPNQNSWNYSNREDQQRKSWHRPGFYFKGKNPFMDSDIKRDEENGATGNPAGGIASIFSDPELIQKLALNPKTSKLLADGFFLQKLATIRSDPANFCTLVINDPSLLEALGSIIGVDMNIYGPYP